MRFSRKNHGAVGVIGVILLVAITVALAGTIYLMLQSFTPSDSAPLAVVISGQLDDDVVSLAPQAGALLAFDSTKVSVEVNGLSYPVEFQTFLSSSAYENGKWESGESLTVDLNVLAHNYSSSSSVHATVVNLNGNTLLYDMTLRKGSSGTQEPQVIPQVVTLTPSNVTFRSAVFQMTFTIEQYSSVNVSFQYKISSSGSWIDTSWVSRSEAGIFVQSVTTLAANTAYVVKAQLRYGSMILTGDEMNFSTSSSPIALWHFNEGSGVIADDSVGSSDGVLIRSPLWVNGKDGKALDFNGNDTYVTVADSNTLDLSTQGTIMAWIYIDTHKSWAGIIHKGALKSFADEAYSLQFNGLTKKILLGFKNATGVERLLTGSTALTTATWYHVAGTWNATTMKVYVNGKPDGSQPTNNILPKISMGSLQIGAQLTEIHPSLGYLGFDGRIDEVMIFNRMVSSEEISSYYHLL